MKLKMQLLGGKGNRMMKSYIYQDNVFSFEGAVSIERNADWVKPWRIDCNQVDFFPGLMEEKGQECSGVRICFCSDSEKLSLDLVEPALDMKLELFVDDHFLQQVIVTETYNTIEFKALPPGMKKITIWLDQRFPCRLRQLKIDLNARIMTIPVTGKRWVHYGSSISQCRSSLSPTTTWPVAIAQELNLHLTNLGMSGQCKLEPMMGRIIRDLPADYITMKLGINIYNGGYTERTLPPNIIGLVQLIREKHPNTPLVLLSPILSVVREATPGISGLTLQEIRQIIADIVAVCRKYGDKNIYYIDGLTLFGMDDAVLMKDEMHPTLEGMELVKDRFQKEVFERLLLFGNC